MYSVIPCSSPGLFYYTLGNMEPRLRSRTDSIQLVAAVKVSYIEEFGIDEMIQPFIEDVAKLESVSVLHLKSVTLVQFSFYKVIDFL